MSIQRRMTPYNVVSTLKRRRVSTGINISKKKFPSKSIKANYSARKNEFHDKHKSYRNQFSIIIKNSKEKYCKYFQNNSHNMENIWKGIKNIINLQSTSSNFPRPLSNYDNIITNPYEVANNLNNYFASIAEITKENIK